MTLESNFNKWIHTHYITNGILYRLNEDDISFIDIVEEYLKIKKLDYRLKNYLIDYCKENYKESI